MTPHLPNLAARTDPHVQHALTIRCEICKAPPSKECTNTINPQLPLPGKRIVHHGRAETTT